MKKQQGTCVEIKNVFYESFRMASRATGYDRDTVKRRCLSNKFPNYQIVPFRIMYTEKRCSKCGEVKLLKEFYNNNESRDGYSCICKKCDSECSKKYKKDNSEHVKEYRETHKEEAKITRQKNRKKENAQERKRRETNLSFKINKNISRAINHCLKGNKNGAHWEDIVGWTVKEGRAHLESLFTEGMTWENYGGGKYEWSLDHEIPICKWGITSAECQALKDCWALDNLQPLWAIRNLQKGNRPMEPKYLIKPF